jgi:hypothetical protein
MLLVTVMQWYCTKRSMSLRPFSDPFAPHLSSNHPPEFSALVVADIPSSKGGKLEEKWLLNPNQRNHRTKLLPMR